MDKSCFYYPKTLSVQDLKQNFILSRLVKYEQIKKRIEKVYLTKKKKPISKSNNFIQTEGKIIQLKHKTRVVYKDKRTSIDSEFSDLSEYKISSINYPRSMLSSWNID